jgi:hypothetical protein
MSALERRAAPDWPAILLPAPGHLPPTAPVRPQERVLHVALRDAREGQPGLARALRGMSSGYAEVDWTHCEREFGAAGPLDAIRDRAAALRPTVVFMQLQRASAITSAFVNELRGRCDPSVVIIDWDGDQHHEADAPARRWFVELGHACDTSLVVNTRHPITYAALGVRHPGYLQIGVDQELYCPTAPTPRTPRTVFLASNYVNDPAYRRRREIVEQLTAAFDADFGVYGGGWSSPSSRQLLGQAEEAGVYTAATVAVSMSIRSDLPRYTSDRLFRALASGAYVLVERFPDMEGLGLDDSNCRAWSDWDQLLDLILRVDLGAPDYLATRRAAHELAHAHHTWDARMGDLMAIIHAVRAARPLG